MLIYEYKWFGLLDVYVSMRARANTLSLSHVWILVTFCYPTILRNFHVSLHAVSMPVPLLVSCNIYPLFREK